MTTDLNKSTPEICKGCQTAAHVLRRIDFRDGISWGLMGGYVQELHATHANAGSQSKRVETQAEYERRVTDALAYGVARDKVKPFGQIVEEYTLLPLCNLHSSELKWLQAGKPNRVTAYLAHPVAGPKPPATGPTFYENVTNATTWLRYLRRLPLSSINDLTGYEYNTKPLILCPWLAGIEEDELYPGGREGVIADAHDTALMFDEVWLVGGRITEGMKVEANAARAIRDLTRHGVLPSSHTEGHTNGVKPPLLDLRKKTQPKR